MTRPPSHVSERPQDDDVRSWADLRPPRLSARWTLGCFLLTLALYLAFLPRFLRFCSPPTGDQAFYLMITASIAQDLDLDLRNNYESRDEDKFYSLAPRPPDFVGMSAPYPLPRHLAVSIARPPAEWYGFHYPGLPALLAPIWIVGGRLGLWWPATVVFMCVVGALLATQIFLLAYEVSHRRWMASAVWLSLSFSHPLMTFSFLLFTELTTGLLLIYALRRLALGWDANGPFRLCVIGVGIAWIPWLAWRCVPLAASLGLYGLVQWWRYRAAARDRLQTEVLSLAAEARRARRALLVELSPLALPVVLSASLLAAYNRFLFGTLLPPTRVPDLGEAAPFHWPWEGLDALSRFATTAFALLFDIQWGLLPYAPLYVLVPLGLVALWRTRHRAHRRLVLALSVVAPYLFVLASYEIWEGRWCPPARFLTTLVPLAAAPLAASIRWTAGWRRGIYLLVYAFGAVWGWLLMALFVHDPRLMWPSSLGGAFEWIALSHPALGRLDLRGVLPSFTRPDEVRHPVLTAGVVGAALGILLLGSMLAAGGRGAGEASERTSERGGTRRLLAAWGAVVVVVAAAWLLMNLPHLKHRTDLQERQRWAIPGPLHDARGIAFWSGRIYVAWYGERFADGSVAPGGLGELDLQTGRLRQVALTSAGESIAWAHPADVKAVEEGLLHVLNNGPGDLALLVVTPQGHVRRRIPLDGTTPVAKGLHVAPGGALYVADMVGGGVAKFGAEGGPPVASWRGQDRLLNNPSGIWSDEDGNVFTTETFDRVQHLDPRDRLIQEYDVGCKPMYFAVPPGGGPWLDLTCGSGLRSIHRQRRFVQPTRSSQSQPRLSAPTGLTYGPDGTLFVLDGSAILALRITH